MGTVVGRDESPAAKDVQRVGEIVNLRQIRGDQDDAGQQLDQRRFTGAVFADNRVNLARLEAKIDGLQRVSGAKSFVKPLKDQ